MGDRCYMSLTCHRKDMSVFEDLGFVGMRDIPDDLVEMVDEQANYAHGGEMPTHVLYFGLHGPGGCYESHRFACDGHKYYEHPVGSESNRLVAELEWIDGVVVPNEGDIRNAGLLFMAEDYVRSKLGLEKPYA